MGTPGRTLDLMERDALKLDKVKYLVIDEADLMLDMGFLEDVKKQTGYMVEKDEKLDCLLNVLIDENPKSCMIFCATREMVNVLYRQLRKAKVRNYDFPTCKESYVHRIGRTGRNGKAGKELFFKKILQNFALAEEENQNFVQAI